MRGKSIVGGLTSVKLCTNIVDMRPPAEVETNRRFTLPVNDKEHRAFQKKCIDEGRSMAEVMRELMREYVARKKK